MTKWNAEPMREQASTVSGDDLRLISYGELHALKQSIKLIQELHKPVIESNSACGDPDCCGEYEEYELCGDCYCDYPCPTIQILDGDIVMSQQQLRQLKQEHQALENALAIKRVRELLPKWQEEAKEFQCACYSGVIEDLIKALDGEQS